MPRLSRLVLILACGTQFGCCCCTGGPNPEKDKPKFTDVIWTAERFEVDGDQEENDPIQISFAKDNHVVITVGGVEHKGLYTLDADADPHRIEIKPDTFNNHEDKPLIGIYELSADGSQLRLKLIPDSGGLPPFKYPRDFSTKGSKDAVLLVLRRKDTIVLPDPTKDRKDR